MLEDRDYMKQPEFGGRDWSARFRPRWSLTVVMLLAYAVVFVVEILVSPRPRSLIPGNYFCYHYFALSKEGLAQGYVWQLITYQFMHAGLLHLLLNSWAIYAFGRELESLLGWRKYLVVLLSSGIVGGVCQALTAWLWPDLFRGPVVGASACAFGLVAAFAMIYPERELTLLIFFVIPVQLRAKTLLIFCAVLAVAGIVFPLDNVANAAHLGGMAMGWLYVKRILRPTWLLGVAEDPVPRQLQPGPPAERSARDFVEDEVNPILEKISAHGLQSLTAREREILERARFRMTRP